MAVRSSRYHPYRFAGRMARQLIVAGAKAAVNYGTKKYLSTSTSTDTGAGNMGVTGQYDSRTVFRKRRPRRGKAARLRRKRAKRSSRSWTKNMLKTLGSTNMVLNDTYAASITGASGQTTCYSHLYAYDGIQLFGGEVGERDVRKLMDNNAAMNEQTEKAIFQTGFMDITFHNTSTEDTKMEVDVYWLKYRRTAQLNSVAAALTDAANVTGLPPGNTDYIDIDITSRGATPFQFPVALSKGISIIKKVKHFVPKGSYFTEQWKDTKPKWFSQNDSAFADNLNYRGYGTTAFIIIKNITGTGATQVGTFSIGSTRTYNVKWLENNKIYNGYLLNGG